jgi:predicted RecB family nuclease
MAQRLLTPSKISAWLECAHSLHLRNELDAGAIEIEPTPMSSLAELLVEKGSSHERNCLADLENHGRRVYQVPGRNPDERFASWVARLAGTLEQGHDVIYQMPFVLDGIRGIADFLVRVDAPGGGWGYEPIDAKLTRAEGKPGHVLQLCFYADAIEHATGTAPERMHLWLGSGDLETLPVEQYRPYWRRLRRQLAAALEEEPSRAVTIPEPCAHCEVCEFAGTCEREWRAADSLVYVAGIRPQERRVLEDAGVATLVSLSRRRGPVPGVHQESLDRLTRQAALQVRSREQPRARPAFEVIEPTEDPVYGHGFDLLPRPSDGDVFFDFEGDPFWSPADDLFFLAGLYRRDEVGRWSYEARWAHDPEGQDTMIRDLVSFFARRRERYPDMHVYHYNHTERSAMERLTAGRDTEANFTRLVATGLFVDLYAVVRNALRVGTESYGLKHLERLAAFERGAGIEQGAGAVVEYERYMRNGDAALLEDIARYNEDDVAATKALRDWLIRERPERATWREAVIDAEALEYDTDELVERLKAAGPDSPRHLLGDLLNYWRRERVANTTPKFLEAASDFARLYDDRDYIANLSLVRFEEGVARGGEPAKYAVMTWLPQLVDHAFARQKSILYTGVGVERGFAYLSELDHDRRELKIRWRERHEESGGLPSVITLDDYVSPHEKPGVLVHLAEQLLEPNPLDPPSSVSMELLARRRPRFAPGAGPAAGVFVDSLEDTLSWVGQLDRSYVAIQGPPGTGKTYRGAHIVHELIRQGQRVGITAMSHAAIDNLLTATHDVFCDRGDLSRLRALRRGARPKADALDGVRYSTRNADVESEDFNLVAGTTWLWARPGLRPYPVDVLLVDEAGQLALADALAAANAARSLLLLGDPLQLAQVSQAEHPGGSGASVLEHVLGDHVTIPETQGVFISETRRMHPDVCRFISEQIYEGRLTSHASCAVQSTEFGTGLRWLRAEHRERSTDSVEEAELVAAQIGAMLATPWVDQSGEVAPLEPRDFMVVAPYNDQVRLLRRVLDASASLAHVQVGTVDKFQGREAPVVFFTMTTSSGEDMPRGPEFLFSRNRLNVAVSRARCLAYLVCTEELLNARARSIEEMRLIGTLSAFVEHAER